MTKLEQARKTPAFRPLDVIVYFLLAALIVVLFLFFGIKTEKKPLEAVSVVLHTDTVIFTYDFESGFYTAEDMVTVETTKEGYRVTVTQEDGGYNIFVIEGDSVRMIDANCSLHKDCVYMQPITDEEGVILCVPHELKICSTTDRIDEPVIG